MAEYLRQNVLSLMAAFIRGAIKVVLGTQAVLLGRPVSSYSFPKNSYTRISAPDYIDPASPFFFLFYEYTRPVLDDSDEDYRSGRLALVFGDL
jgi:hypothetical protein